MPHFQYKALNQSGSAVNGTIEANDRRQAVLKLKKTGIKPLSIKEKTKKTSGSHNFFKTLSQGAANSTVSPKYSDKIILAFLKKVFQLHKSGMPIGDTIRTLHQRLSDPKLQQLSEGIWRELSEGRSLAECIRRIPNGFDSSTSYLIEAGEATGNLIPVLENITGSLENKIQLKKRVTSGLAYPALICSMAIAVTIVMLFFLLPRIQEMMEGMGGELSLPAKILIGFSELLITYGPFAGAGMIAAFLCLSQWRKKEDGKAKTDQWLLKTPLVSKILSNIETCRICNLLGTLLKSGVNTTEALRLTERSIQNVVVQKQFQEARLMVNDGATFSSAFRKHAILDDEDIDILGVGENTGDPANSLKEVHDLHQEQLSAQFSMATNILIAGAMSFAFSMVLLIVLSVVMSVLGLSSTIQG